MTIIYIAGAITVAIGAIISLIASKKSFLTFIGLFIFFCGAATMVTADYEGKPSAMDVYQGKTTLKTTYKDGVAIDSVVVFK